MNINEKYQNLLNDLEQNEKIEILHLNNKIKDIKSEIIKMSFEDFKEISGVDYYSYFNVYYGIFGRLQVAWKVLSKSGPQVSGEINLINFNDIFLKESKLFHEGMSKDKIDLLRSLKPFDDHSFNGDGMLGAFRLITKSGSPEIWFYDNGDAFKLKISLSEYFNHLLNTKGFLCWQLLFCDLPEDYLYRKIRLETINNALSVLPEVFEDTDFSTYQNLFKNLG